MDSCDIFVNAVSLFRIILIDSLAIANPSFSFVGYPEIFFSVRSLVTSYFKKLLMNGKCFTNFWTGIN